MCIEGMMVNKVILFDELDPHPVPEGRGGMNLLLGLGGKSGAGKSTAADYLTQRYGLVQVAFADRLKQVARMLFDWELEMVAGPRRHEALPGLPLSPDGEAVTPRRIMQALGDFGRQWWPDIWVYHLLGQTEKWQARGLGVVVPDVRFRNEAAALRTLGAKLVLIRRPGAGLAGEPGAHASETELDGWQGWDYVIGNDGGLEELQEKLAAVIEEIA
jgi:hypothetical protein